MLFWPPCWHWGEQFLSFFFIPTTPTICLNQGKRSGLCLFCASSSLCFMHFLLGKPFKHCLLEIMTFHLPRLFVCLLDYLHACQRTFRDLKNDRFRIFSFCGTSPSSLRFFGTLVLSTWACTLPLRQHIPSILPFCFQPSFVLPPSDSDRQRQVLGIQSLVL